MRKERTSSRNHFLIALSVSLGGFLFGFDAAVISGVTGYIVPQFHLSDLQLGWVVASLTMSSALAMLTVGPLSDQIGRKPLLMVTGILYAISALFSAVAPDFTTLVIARMVGGLAVGAALILAPMYIAETSSPQKRGQMVSIQQLNIVLGFSAAYFSNYYLLQISQSTHMWVIEFGLKEEVWRWMLGIEIIPAILFSFAMIFVPRSPRWLMLHKRKKEAWQVLKRIHPLGWVEEEFRQMEVSINQTHKEVSWNSLWSPSLRSVLFIGLVVGILQQITGVNAIYFYATTIFEQSGVGKDAAFAQAIWVGIINVVFTLVAMWAIDRLGRRPLLLVGIVGVALSMVLTAYGFSEARYQLTLESLQQFEDIPLNEALLQMEGHIYDSDVVFKRALKTAVGEELYGKYQGELIAQSIQMNAWLILIGILGFVASFALSLGPVMWVLLSELFPNWIRGLAISVVGFVNAVVSFLVQLAFPWELSHFGNATSYVIYAIFAIIGLILVWRYLPETKGKSLEEIEKAYAT